MSRHLQGGDVPSRFPDAAFRKFYSDLVERYHWTLQLLDFLKVLEGTKCVWETFDGYDSGQRESVLSTCSLAAV